MINAPPQTSNQASELAVLIREHLDELVTYATHLTGNADDAMGFVAAGLYKVRKYPSTRLQTDSKTALYSAVTKACEQELQFPPRRFSLLALFKAQPKSSFYAETDMLEASMINTIKRALMTLEHEKRAALLLRDFVNLDYKAISRVLEKSPDSIARILAIARRRFGIAYREIAL